MSLFSRIVESWDEKLHPRSEHGKFSEARASCLDCVRKHLGQAEVLMSEALQGYPRHRWLAIGHLGEAADEAVQVHPALAAAIREHRLKYMADPTYPFPTDDLIKMADDLVETTDLPTAYGITRPMTGRTGLGSSPDSPVLQRFGRRPLRVSVKKPGAVG